MTTTRTASCNCGAVRITLSGDPVRTGLCHCMTCRKETGARFMYFGVWPGASATVTGHTERWTDMTEQRHVCPTCGSRRFATVDGEDHIEVRLGMLDEAPTRIAPGYELFAGRREPWLPPIPGLPRHAGNRDA